MYPFSKALKGIMAMVIAISVAACSGGDGSVRTLVPDGPAPAPADPPGPNIVDVATEAGSFNTLLAAATAAGLVETLSDESASLTLFAPTDAAFDALFATMPEGAKDELLADTERLTSILTYHVLEGAVDIAAAGELAGTAVETVSGEKVALTIREDAYLYVNEGKVDPYDVMASNGVIHVIDKVLLPPEPDTSAADMTIVEIASANEDFETLVTAVTAADLVGTLGNPDAMLTVFAPTDDAFAMLGDLGLDYLTSDLDLLTNTLLYHVIDGAVDSIDAAAAYNQSVTMINGDPAGVTIVDGMLMIGGATVVTKDIVASNGIIHVIDAVIMPPSAGPAPLAVEASAAGFSTLVTAVEAAGMTEDLLDANANLTVFAPTNDAFDALPDGALDELLADPDALANVLAYHVYPDTVDSATAIALDGNSITMLNGESVAVSVVDGNLFVNDAQVVAADVEASNGIIHVIDQVLIPTGVDSAELADFSGTFAGSTVTDEVYEFPSGAEGYAGFANDNTDLYPFTFEFGGKITFTAAIPEGGTPANVRFVFENAPYPDINPNFSTENVLVSGGEAVYTVDIPAQDPAQTFSSFLMYIVERDSPVYITNVVATSYETDPNAATYADFSGTFAGSTVEDEVYTFPTGAEGYAGFANDNAALYPFTFGFGGKITFTAAIPEGGSDANVRFVFENAPYPDTNPNFSTANVLISGGEATYTVDIPSQDPAQTFESFLMYIVERDSPVMVKNVVVTAYTEDDVADFGGTFAGTTVENDVYTFPTGAQGYAGFANDNGALYPLSFPNGGKVTFSAAIPNGGTDTNVRFVFENAPYPDVNPNFSTENVLVSGSEAFYTVEVAPQDAAQTFSSLLMYVVERDSPVMVKNVVVRPY
ncbi:MAG: hypothetical protein CBB81_01790 [Cellvibrionales bacterium TMED21]|nr:hypothetical protein [Halieaceae bacterium]OUT67126.1 MAG: hypothetical protein CBB81_01790 [Cellvibrionales bacterium TMED21]